MSSFRGACSDFAGSSRNIALKCRLLHYFIRKYHFVVKLLCLCLTQSIKLISTKLQSKATKTFSSEVMKHLNAGVHTSTRAKHGENERDSPAGSFQPVLLCSVFFLGGGGLLHFLLIKEKKKSPHLSKRSWNGTRAQEYILIKAIKKKTCAPLIQYRCPTFTLRRIQKELTWIRC